MIYKNCRHQNHSGRHLVLACLVLSASIAGCYSKPETTQLNEISFRPLASLTASDGNQMFIELTTGQTGVEFTNELKPEHMRNYLLNGAGICSGDYDNDGRVDFYVVSQDGGNKLFRQTADWKFEDVTTSAGNLGGGDYWGTGASFADIDNDSDLDLYVCNINGPNLLYLNNGDGTFVESGAKYRIDYDGPTTMGAFADFDNDGDLDLYLLNNRIFKLDESHSEVKIIRGDDEIKVHPDFVDDYFVLNGTLHEAGSRDILLRNEGGVFKNITENSGIGGSDMGLSATWWDFDDDGWIDLYVGNDMKSPDHLYHNQGDGTFVDVLPFATGKSSWFSMGADSADINNDGLPDFLTADMSSTTHYKQKVNMGEMGRSAWFLEYGSPRQFMQNVCLLHSGTGRFLETAGLTGLASTDWTWSVKFGDQDCDGFVDVFFTNGVARNMNDSDMRSEYDRLIRDGEREKAKQQIYEMPELRERNLFFKNDGDLKFSDASANWGADFVGVSHGCTSVDIDRDGDLDLIVNNMNDPISIYRNDCSSGNRLLIKLTGTKSNRFGVDSKVVIKTASGIQTRQLTLARGFMSAEEPLIQFGVGEDSKIEKLTVEWSSGIVQEFEDIDVNQFVEITEQGTPKTKTPKPFSQTPSAGQFVDVTNQKGLTFKHREVPFNDYAHQPLLPNKLSQLGSGQAWADVNGDGFQDCFFGGATNQSGEMKLGSADGSFKVQLGPWKEHSLSEDMAPLFLDFDSDGDQDLLVLSGSYEKAESSERLRNRIYVNDGQGNFSIGDSSILPDNLAANSCAAAADFDRDGDLDLFIGTRVVPRNWPMPTSSFLWINEGGKFVNASESVAPDLKNIGLVTGAVWSDANSDGFVDLFLSMEWGPIKYFENSQGKLVDRTREAGLADNLGWWNSIIAGDVDHDGDMDLVALNTGLNSKYHASSEHPIHLYVNDFDENGRIDLVEAEWEGDKCFPIRGKSCSSSAMPFLKEKFDTYHEFAMAEIDDIYSEDSLKESLHFYVNNLESSILINDGQGHFSFQELPRIAQVAPGFGVAIEDFTGDGRVDIVIGQNFLHPQPETGRMDGGTSLLLKGNGQGDFEVVTPAESGIVITGQAMSLAAMDVNNDAIPDLSFTVNDDLNHVLENRISSQRKHFKIRLAGGNGNLTGVGSTINISTTQGDQRVFEIHGGAGYLSQASGECFFSMNPGDSIAHIRVRWPDGIEQEYSVEPTGSIIRIERQNQVNTATNSVLADQ